MDSESEVGFICDKLNKFTWLELQMNYNKQNLLSWLSVMCLAYREGVGKETLSQTYVF